jgi:hypothetical protein
MFKTRWVKVEKSVFSHFENRRHFENMRKQLPNFSNFKAKIFWNNLEILKFKNSFWQIET